MISVLSFVPIADTIQVFEALSNHVGNQQQVILDYFESNYRGELRRGRRLAPRFPNAMWNMSFRVQNREPTTTLNDGTKDLVVNSNNDMLISGNLHRDCRMIQL